MATKIPAAQFELNINGKKVGIDVKENGRFYARTKDGENAKTLDGLQRSLEAKYPPDGIGGIPVVETYGDREGVCIGRAPTNSGSNAFLVVWKGKKITEVMEAGYLSLPRTPEQDAKLAQFNTEIEELEGAQLAKEDERDAFIESFGAEDTLKTAFPKRKR